MREIVWNRRLSTGDEYLDAQNQDLISALQALADAIRSGERKSVLLESFHSLDRVVREHFRDEEFEMERWAILEAEANRSAHRRFLHTLFALEARLRLEGPSESLADEVVQELGKWFMHHILLLDTRLKDRKDSSSGVQLDERPSDPSELPAASVPPPFH